MEKIESYLDKLNDAKSYKYVMLYVVVSIVLILLSINQHLDSNLRYFFNTLSGIANILFLVLALALFIKQTLKKDYDPSVKAFLIGLKSIIAITLMVLWYAYV